MLTKSIMRTQMLKRVLKPRMGLTQPGVLARFAAYSYRNRPQFDDLYQVVGLLENQETFNQDEALSVLSAVNELTLSRHENDTFYNSLQNNDVFSERLFEILDNLSTDPSLDIDQINTLAQTAKVTIPSNYLFWSKLVGILENHLDRNPELYLKQNDFLLSASAVVSIFGNQYPKVSEALFKILEEDFSHLTTNTQIQVAINLINSPELENYLVYIESWVHELDQIISSKLKDANLQELIWIYSNIIATEDRSRIREISPAIEKRFNSIKSTGEDLTQVSKLCTLISYFGAANHQSDQLWDYLTKVVVNIGETLNQGQLGDVIYGFAHAQRGSNKFWDYIMNLYNNLDQNQNINTDLLVLKSLIVVEIHNKEFYDNKVQGILEKKALEENHIQEYSHENLSYIVNNLDGITEQQIVDLTAKIEYGWPVLGGFVKNRIIQNYQNAQNSDPTLDELFNEFLESQARGN